MMSYYVFQGEIEHYFGVVELYVVSAAEACLNEYLGREQVFKINKN
jgi:hypothetical protein